MEKILVSACLLGEKVNYLGTDNKVEHTIFDQWQAEGRCVVLCPEVAGGLPVPRPACEIKGDGSGLAVLKGEAKVVSQTGDNFTQAFLAGAQIALDLCKKYQIKLAILKAGSPSCGSQKVYNGKFNGSKIEGMGTTAAALSQAGIQCFSELRLQQAQDYLQKLENTA
ncbi:MAG TPA: DUF523 domain-containing protein [Oligoflexia bacterium]|nr:DUF523 domain-containing protein [Oligoflexia bacterium]HMR25092.1 DUF523 domain-containing protein [Oligoflexia bacterium]